MISRFFLIGIYFIFLIQGCVEKSLKKPSIETLNDVTYKLNKQGNLNLEKEYQFKETNQSLKTVKVVSKAYHENKHYTTPYERVPSFEGDGKGSLVLNNREKSFMQNKKIVVKGGKVKVTVEDIPIPLFIDLIFSKVLNVNYTVNAEVKALKNTITLNINKPQLKQQVFEVVKEILLQEGVETIKENGTFFLSKLNKVHTPSVANMSNYIGYGRTLNNDISDTKDVIQFVPYHYINPKNSVGILRKAGFTTLDFYYPINGIQMIRAKAGVVRRALKLIQLIDRPFLKGKTSYLINLEYIDVSKFSKRIRKIFKLEGINTSDSMVNGTLLMSEIPELNSLLIISPNDTWFKKILYWKDKLDIQSELEFQEEKLYTYKVKYRKADELAEAVNAMLKIQNSRSPRSVKKTLEGVASSSLDSPTSTLVQSNGMVTADLFSNMLMMKLLPKQYNSILPFIEKLDVYPLQVAVEVTVAEVTLTDTFSLGFEYALKNNAAITGVTGLLSNAVTAVLGRDSGISATYSSKNLSVIIDAFAQKKLLNIVSKPKLVILNNGTGSINVGQQIPIVNSESSAQDLTTTGTPSILRNISYRNTGITVNLKPTINSDGLLTMDISLTLSEAQLNDTSSIDSPLIINRSLATSLVMKSGGNVLIGGLISSNNSSTEGGVPLLRDIPILGHIFKGDSQKKIKTELIMLIRPLIIKNPEELLNHSQKYRLIMKSIKNLAI